MMSFFKDTAKTVHGTASMIYTQYKVSRSGWKAHHKIADGLFLGMLPIKEAAFVVKLFTNKFDNQHEQITSLVKESNPDRPLKLIVSAVEPNELKGEPFATVNSTVTTKDWKSINTKIDHHVVSIPDETADVKNEELTYAVIKMRMCINESGSVYVHCKAGRGRSAMLCAIYLAVFGENPNKIEEMSLEKAIRLIQLQRKQVKLHHCQKEKAILIIEEIKQLIKHKVIKDEKKHTPDNKDAKTIPATVADKKTSVSPAKV